MENSTEPQLMSLSSINTNDINNSISNRDLYITRIENTMTAIEDQNLSNDRRYSQLYFLKAKLSGTYMH